MTKILIGVICTLTILLSLLAVYAKHERDRYQQARADMNNLRNSLVVKTVIADTTDKVVEETAKKATQIKTQIDEIKNQVKVTALQEDNNEISPSDADVAYLNSMWSTYCQAGISDPHCSP